MDLYRSIYTVEMMASVLGVSARSYYNFQRGVYTKRAVKEDNVVSDIQRQYAAAKGRYGSPRIAAELQAQGIRISRTTVSKYMHKMGLRSKLARKFKVTTDSKHTQSIAPNILNRGFDVAMAGLVWVSDITYIQTKESFICLTTVIDLYDRKVIGWSTSDNMTTTDTVLRALAMALRNRTATHGLVFHSDRGAQYASNECVNMLKNNGIVQSMNRRGNCWDNAVAESFSKA